MTSAERLLWSGRSAFRSLWPGAERLYRLERRLQRRSSFSDCLPQRTHVECCLEVDLPTEQGIARLDRAVSIGGIGPGRFMNPWREQPTDRLDGASRETRPVLRDVGIQGHQDAFGLDYQQQIGRRKIRRVRLPPDPAVSPDATDLRIPERSRRPRSHRPAECGRNIVCQRLADPFQVSQDHADILQVLLIAGTFTSRLSWQLKGQGAPLAGCRIETDSGKVVPIPREHSLGDLVWTKFPACVQIVEVPPALLVDGIP